MSSEPRFSPDGKFIFFIADDDGTQNLCRVPPGGGEITRPIGGRLMVYATLSPSQAKSPRRSPRWIGPARSTPSPRASVTRITHTNDELMSQLKLTAPEYVKFKSKDGTTVSGYLYKPLDYVPGKKVPHRFCVRTVDRCGPTTPSFIHLAAALRGATGTLCYAPNPRGSSGYGQHYRQSD